MLQTEKKTQEKSEQKFNFGAQCVVARLVATDRNSNCVLTEDGRKPAHLLANPEFGDIGANRTRSRSDAVTVVLETWCYRRHRDVKLLFWKLLKCENMIQDIYKSCKVSVDRTRKNKPQIRRR